MVYTYKSAAFVFKSVSVRFGVNYEQTPQVAEALAVKMGVSAKVAGAMDVLEGLERSNSRIAKCAGEGSAVTCA